MQNGIELTQTISARKERKRWSDRFIPECQCILAEWSGCSPDDVQIASYEDDYKNATDLIMPSGERVAVKTRRADVLAKYPNEICLRHNPASPYPTEYHKVLQSKVRFLLYTYCDPTETHLMGWKLYDLTALWIADFFGVPISKNEVHIEERDVHLICFDAMELQSLFQPFQLALKEPE